MAWEPPEVTNWQPPEVSAQDQNSPMPQGPSMAPIQPQGSNPAMMGLNAAAQTFGIQPNTATTPTGQALQTIQNQIMAPARLSNTLGGASAPASQGASNLMQQAGAGPLMQGAAGLVVGAAVDPRSYVMPGGDVSVTPENLPGAKLGEMVSGTPASNLDRAYKGGFYQTYIAPQSIEKSGQEFGEALQNAVTKHLTPEEQGAILFNPKGEANQKVSDVYVKWLNGEPISTQEAVGAKVGIGTIYPTKLTPKAAKLSEFENTLNGIIAQDPSPEAQAFAKANSNYAASALRSNLSKPLPVNKSNPNEYSKLGRYLIEGSGAIGLGAHSTAPGLGAAAALGATSPLAMGVAASGAGSLADLLDRAAGNPAIRALVAKYLEQGQSNVPIAHQGTSQ